ncbi:MAG: TlpA disulfide reductase family protein [Aquificaceae bacterium]|nr:TlpA family protein disulfide reductase [Aquificaceae bacterium]MDW8066405.1 TlpA disulfide reductase family protein [Aquificaceae bacterium]MDW8423557.1 TlpA disulfide reductase family protein [Aquificaceae bacterium]
MFKVLLLLLLFAVSCSGDRLPKVPVKTLDNRTVYLSEFKGRPLVIYVWSRTCAGHVRDLKELERLSKEHKDYLFISYAVGMEPQEVEESYRKLNISAEGFITLVDTPVRFNDYFSITFLPSTYFFDSKGRFLRSYPGLAYPDRAIKG